MADVGVFAWVWLGLAALGVVLAVAWVLVPLMLFGIKPLLRQLIQQQQRTNHLLEALRDASRAAAK